MAILEAHSPSVLAANLELRHLSALGAVADTGTFGRAAERLGYTQSAVSQQIAALERVVGGSLFDRPGGPKAVRLTPLGKVVLAHARDLLERASTTAEAIERFKSGESGRLDIATFQSVSAVLLPPIIRQLVQEHPGADIRLDESEEAAITGLLGGKVDVCFTVGPVHDDFESVVLLDDPYVLVARRGEFPDGPVDVTLLDGLQMVAYPPTCDQNRVEHTLDLLGVHPLIVFRTADNGAVQSMVRAGMGCAVMPLLAIDIDADHAELSMHALVPTIEPRPIVAVWAAQRTMSPLARRLVDIAVDVSADLAARERECPALLAS